MNREKTLVCNGCGKLIKVENDLIREGVFRVNYDWGYFSEKDGERHMFCLCETCYDRITRTFRVPVTVEEYL